MHTGVVQTQRLTSTEGFVLFDLDDGPAVGPVRLARKVLQSSATDLARTITYRCAAFGLKMGGASAGINAEGDGRRAAVAAFVEEASALVSAGRFLPEPGTGVGEDDLAALTALDSRSPRRAELVDGTRLEDLATAAGIVAAASAATGGLAGARIAAVGVDAVAVLAAGMAIDDGARLVAVGGPSGTAVVPAGIDRPRLAEAFASRGSGLVEALTSEPAAAGAALEAECDVLFVGGRPGTIDHDVADRVKTRLVVPTAPLPVTARGYAVARRGGVVVLPDFVTMGGGLVTWSAADETAAELLARARGQVADLVAGLLDHDEGPILAACYVAEDFLRTWCESLPFGRPFAP